MPKCGFCGHANLEGARSCLACGYVFGAEGSAAAAAPLANDPDPGLFGELVSLTTPEAAPERAPAASTLANLFDRDPVIAASRQAMILAGAALALALAATVGILIDTTDALWALDAAGARAGGALSIAPRTDLVSLAEISLLAGALVMLGGWSQQVAANRALLDVPSPRHSARWALIAWLIPGPNVALPGVLVRELWADNTPPAATTATPWLVSLWPAVFGAGLGARYGALLYGFLAAPDIEERSDATLTAAVLVGALVVWVAALALTIVMVRHLTQRQLARADALRGYRA